MTVIGERMLDLRQVRRVFDTKPWAAHLYVTEQCNLDCHYCNEFNNSIPHPALADLKKWMDHIRKLDVMRLGLQGGEPLKHPDIVEVVRYAKCVGFCKVSMSTNGFLLNRQLLADLEGAGLDELQISVDRMTPIASTRKSMKSILHKLDWFKDSKVRLNVSGVLFKETLDEMGQVIDTCLDLGIRVHARVVHDDLVHDRALRDPTASEPLRYVGREAAGMLATRVSKMRGGQPERIRDLVGGCRNGHNVAAGRGQDAEPTSTQVIKDQSHACGAGCK